MKKILFLLSLVPVASVAQDNLFSKNNIITYSLCFVAGASDGLNDAIVAHDPFPQSQFWSLYGQSSYDNKDQYGWLRREVLTFTTDGYHLTKFITYSSYCVAVGFTIADKDRNWKYITCKILISFAAHKVGQFVTYNIIFK